jgi:hypothetical protein
VFFAPNFLFSVYSFWKAFLIYAQDDRQKEPQVVMATSVDLRGKRALLVIPPSGKQGARDVQAEGEKDDAQKFHGLNVARSLVAHGCR